jgi:nucleotide-binding universal stress UspA family protein
MDPDWHRGDAAGKSEPRGSQVMIQSNHRPMPLVPVEVPSTTDLPVVVCGVDGSDESLEIARIGAALAATLSGRTELVHVMGGGPRLQAALAVDDERRTALAMLDSLCDASESVASARLVEFGDPARRLAAVAESVSAQLIVVGTRGNVPVNDALLGSVSGRLAADAPCPVLIVGPSMARHVRPGTWRGRTVVCGFDGSDSGWAAAMAAGRLAAPLQGIVSLVSVGSAISWRMSDVAVELAEALAADGVEPPSIDWDVRSGDPAWELERVASAATAPIICIGSRGLGPRGDPLLGSVTRRLLLGARRSILVVPATSAGFPSS